VRKEEIEGKCPGAVYFLFGTACAFVLFEPCIGLLALLHLSFGDPAAAHFGINTNTIIRYKHGKSLNGFLGAFAVCTLVTWTWCYCCEAFCLEEFKSGFEVDSVELMVYSFVSGLVTAIIEFGPLELLFGLSINDNVSIPVVTSFFLRNLRQSLIG